MSIIIGADIVPTKTNYDLFSEANVDILFGQEILSLLSSCDFKIFNLETPITDTPCPIKKNGPALRTPEKTLVGIKALGINLLTLANNHIFDQGEIGLKRTIDLLVDYKIDFVGAGNNLYDAQKPYIFEFNNKKIGVYSCAEHEFSIATEDSAGANPFDPLESLDHVVKLKKECDYVIVLYHGGKEHYRYPSPNLQKTCRKLIEKGANLVVCQHSHCIGCEEKYKEGTIVYGQGNFIFDYSQNAVWKTGLLIKITDDLQIEYIPIQKIDNTVRLASGNEKDKILLNFYNRSKQIKNPEFVKEEYAKLASQIIYRQMATINNPNKFFMRVMNKITGQRFSKWYINKKYKTSKYALKNMAECESLRELFVEGIKYIGE